MENRILDASRRRSAAHGSKTMGDAEARVQDQPTSRAVERVVWTVRGVLALSAVRVLSLGHQPRTNHPGEQYALHVCESPATSGVLLRAQDTGSGTTEAPRVGRIALAEVSIRSCLRAML